MHYRNHRMKAYKFALLLLPVLFSCRQERSRDSTQHEIVEERLRDLTQKLTRLETTDSLDSFLQFYDEHAIVMPEYQLTLHGQEEIKSFYREIFNRQKIVTFHRQTHEFIHMNNTIVEIGVFRKEFRDPKSDTLISLHGKYWMVWQNQPDGRFKIKGESFGFFHSVEHPESLIVSSSKTQPGESDLKLKTDTPFELKAYNALMEKGVRTRDGNLRSQFFTKDGSVYPFADTTVTGIDRIKPYLIAYSSRGAITIDSIMCYTYEFETHGEYILEYDMFKVKWSVPNYSGRTEGKGIRIWKRQEDKSLKLYREIGTHNHLQ